MIQPPPGGAGPQIPPEQLHQFLTEHPIGRSIAAHTGYASGHPMHDIHQRRAMGAHRPSPVKPSVMAPQAPMPQGPMAPPPPPVGGQGGMGGMPMPPMPPMGGGARPPLPPGGAAPQGPPR